MKQHVKLYEDFDTRRPSQFFKTYEETENWLIEMGIKNYEITQDLLVNVDGNVNLSQKNIKYIPVQFDVVFGCFYIYGNNLTSLEGCPTYVERDFSCSGNQLTSLYKMPKNVKGLILCNNNKLTSLVFSPKIPISYHDNPCEYFYRQYGFNSDAHMLSILKRDPNPGETLRRLRPVYPERYFDIINNSKELKELSGESEELIKTYDKVKDIEKGYF